MDSTDKTYTAAALIIGNEILSGRTQDKNTQYIAEKLNDAGVRLVEVRVVPDVEDKIVEALNALRAQVDYVFTTGGIGPTHDDITAESVAAAFGVEVEQNKEAYDLLLAHYDGDEAELTEPRLKMTMLPVGASLVLNPVSGAPGFKVENVYVMAGVPNIMRGMLDSIVPTLTGGAPVLSETVDFDQPESAIAEALGEIQAEFPTVDIGSYPQYKDGRFAVSVVLRCADKDALDQAKQKVQDIFL